jgi:Zn-dependent peptidase ImmA (M78 family)
MGFFDPEINPEIYARELLFELNIDSIPVQVDVICAKLNIECIYTSQIDAEAIIAKKGQKVIIAVNTKTNYHTRARFSIAHELGHFKIPTHLLETFVCSTADLNSYSLDNLIEKEANIFASELLMPVKFFGTDVRKLELSLNNFQLLADKYDTSLLSTAIRFINFTIEKRSYCLC